MRRLLAGLVVAAAFAGAAGGAGAGVTGGCRVAVFGVDLADRGTGATAEPVTFDRYTNVAVAVRGTRPATTGRVMLGVAGLRWTMRDVRLGGRRSWTTHFQVANQAKWGVGLFRIDVTSAGPGGDESCHGSGLVEVTGRPFSTVAAATAVGVAILGLAGLVASAAAARRGRRRPVVTGTLAGLATAAATLTLLQELGALFPTVAVTVALLVAGAAVGCAATLAPALRRPPAGATPRPERGRRAVAALAFCAAAAAVTGVLGPWAWLAVVPYEGTRSAAGWATLAAAVLAALGVVAATLLASSDLALLAAIPAAGAGAIAAFHATDPDRYIRGGHANGLADLGWGAVTSAAAGILLFALCLVQAALLRPPPRPKARRPARPAAPRAVVPKSRRRS
jgi:hypothetical protein